jgi:hypothetical protein
MLKNTSNAKSNKDALNGERTHFSYDEYRKKVVKHSYKDLMVFISVLVIGILIFLGFAKILSPNVDVGIGDNEEYTEFEDEGIQGSVDERLKHLRDEDDGKGADDSMFSPELDEKVVLPKQIKKTVGEMEAEMQDAKLQQVKAEEPASAKPTEKDDKAQKAPVAQKHEDKAPAPAQSQSSYRVVVGYYATEKQAEVAKSIIQDAGVGVTPIVKNIGGTYTLQVGVYSSHEKAQQSVNNLLKNNFPARIAE